MKNRTGNLFPTITLILALLVSVSVSAQTGINSPYSRFGYGLLSDNSIGIAKSMGGIGAGFRMPNRINVKNPASYSSVDTLTFIADMGLSLSFASFQENGVRVNATNAGIDHMAMQFRILPKVGMTLGFMPFSKIGYEYSSSQVIRRDEDGVVTSTSANSGTGALRQFMAGLGWRPSGWLSVGVNASYLTGDMTLSSPTTFSSTGISSTNISKTAEMAALKLDFGIQSTLNVSGNTLVLGATYTPALDLESEATKIATDTVSVSDAFSMPELMTAGFTYRWNRGMIGADVSYQTWSKARFFGEQYGLDRLTASAGYMIQPDEYSKNMFKRASYQVGARFAQPYVMVGDSKGPWEFGVTAGMSMPVNSSYNSMAYLHVSGEYVRVQPMTKGMIVENYFRINIGVTFLERWFMKWMVD